MKDMTIYMTLGLMAGILSGLIGIGGGVIIVPALMFLFGFSQHLAQGTTLAAMVPPIGLLAAYEYYNKGFVDMKVAGLIAVGFFIGGFFGARIATYASNEVLHKIFGIILILLGVKLFTSK